MSAPTRFYLHMRRTAAEVRVNRLADKATGSWTSNRCLKYFTGVGTLEEAHAWAMATGNVVELRRTQTQIAPDYSMMPDGRAKRGFL